MGDSHVVSKCDASLPRISGSSATPGVLGVPRWLASGFGIVPLLGFAMLLIGSLPGTPGTNHYGSGPGSELSQTPPLTESSYTARRHATRVLPNMMIGATSSHQSNNILDTIAESERLAGLLYDGALTNEEFDVSKQRLLA